MQRNEIPSVYTDGIPDEELGLAMLNSGFSVEEVDGETATAHSQSATDEGVETA